MATFRNNIAQQCGIYPAIIAEHLWYLYLNEACSDREHLHHGSYWCRCSQMSMVSEFPFMTRHMVEGAVAVLKKKGLIRSGCFNEDRFDHTNWYTFTEYGVNMMEANIPRLAGRQDYEIP